jgi:Ca2+-binding EF-hand superfamily protein
MNVSHKKVGLGLVALAVALMGTAAVADKGGMKMPGMGMGGHMGMMRPAFDFAAADANKDGKVTAEEFAAARAAMVAGVDTDKDGLLSVDELAAMHLKAMEAASKDMATRMVKNLDADGDGKLSASEMAAMPVPPNAFERADTNKDGAIDQAEADAMAQHGPDGMMGGHNGKHGKGGQNGMMDGHNGKHGKGGQNGN